MRIIKTLVALALLLGATIAAKAQGQTLPPNTVLGRTGISPGPAQAIPFASFGQLLSPWTSLIVLGSPPGASHNQYSLSPLLAGFFNGNAGVPTPEARFQPSVSITRYEAVPAADMTGGQDAALYVETASDGGSGTQSTAITANVEQNQAGGGDATAILATAVNHSTGAHAAFAISAVVLAYGASQAQAIQTGVNNNTGSDQPWTIGAGIGISTACDCAVGGTNLATAGISLRNTGNQYDVGFGAHTNSVKTAFAEDDSSSITVLKATQTHTNGVDLSGAIITTAAFKSSGFTVNGSGALNALTYSASGIAGVGCAAATVNLTTLVVTNGIVTHC